MGLRLIGSIDRFVATTGFTVEGAARRQYQLAYSAVSPDGGDLPAEPAYVEGRKLRIEEAVVLATHL